jgi:DNA-binding phage protein
MPLTRSFKETVLEDIQNDPEFAAALLREGVDALLSGELEVGKDVLRDYTNGTIGFETLARKTKIPVKSLMRMLGPSGNPRASNLLAIIEALQRHAGVELHLAAE